MTRKRFIKKLQSIGVQRNVANWMARNIVPVGHYGEFISGYIDPYDFPDQALVNVATTREYFKIKVSKREARRIAEQQLQKYGLDVSGVHIAAEHRVGRGGGGHD